MIAFQQGSGLTADGRVGPQTWAKLVATTAPADRPTLRLGSQGEAVRWMQQRLGITADGDFGPATDACRQGVPDRQRAEGRRRGGPEDLGRARRLSAPALAES